MTDLPINYPDYTNGKNSFVRKTAASGDLPKPDRPGVLFLSSWPPRECGIATYTSDLVNAINTKFDRSFALSVCALESSLEQHRYADVVSNVLNTDDPLSFDKAVVAINHNNAIQLVVVQHEYGFFSKNEAAFLLFLKSLRKPFVITFHTVLPSPDERLLRHVSQLAALTKTIVVMTLASQKILLDDYRVPPHKIVVIPHGTHLVASLDKAALKLKHGLGNAKILSTFGLLSSGKSIETTLHALPSIIDKHPDTLFLIIGKTHPGIVRTEGEKYREKLAAIVESLGLNKHVRFLNSFLPLPELLDYLQMTDVYVFTSNDPNQAVSGTFSYAISSGCAIVSTRIPHACEVLQNDPGFLIGFENSGQLSDAVNRLLSDEDLRIQMGSNGLHRMAFTAWENSAVAHAGLFSQLVSPHMPLQYRMPSIDLSHMHRLTTPFGIIQFARINHPDIRTGYTLDDNARALIAACQHFEQTRNNSGLAAIRIYLDFIHYCLQPDGGFLNYVGSAGEFTHQNRSTNLADSNGRAIWALGYVASIGPILPTELVKMADEIMEAALVPFEHIHSTRAMAFAIKGLYYRWLYTSSEKDKERIAEFANRLLQMYRHEATDTWQWFESYLTYGNSILPESLLCAWQATGEPAYREAALSSFDFLLSKIFFGDTLKVVSNKTWLYRDQGPMPTATGGEQPIDVAYTVLALARFYEVFHHAHHREKMNTAFSWFLGNNHLHQIIYNPCTGGCYDGLEEYNVNLNQGAESTVSYLMARLTLEKLVRSEADPGTWPGGACNLKISTSSKENKLNKGASI